MQPSLAKIKISRLPSVRLSHPVLHANNYNTATLLTPIIPLLLAPPLSNIVPSVNSADLSTTSLIGPPGKKDARNGDMKDVRLQ